MELEKKFFKTTIVIEVVSREDFSDWHIEGIVREYTEGLASAKQTMSVEMIDGKQLIKELEEQGSSPEFAYVIGYDNEDDELFDLLLNSDNA